MGTGWSEENRGWQDPTFHCPSFHYGEKSPARLSNALPGPACPHTHFSVCKVQTVLCGKNCALVYARKKYACTSVSINPPTGVWSVFYCMRARVFCTVDRTAGSRRRSAIVNRNTDLHVCLRKTKQSVVSLSYTPVFGHIEEECAFCIDTTHALCGHLQRNRSRKHFFETYQAIVSLYFFFLFCCFM